MKLKPLSIRRLGIRPYKEAYTLQLELNKQRLQEEIPDTLLLLQHPHVITLGKRGSESDLLLPDQDYIDRGIEVVHTDRGGQVTYHGPGQLVGYIISHLYNHDRRLRWFVETLEGVISDVLRDSYELPARGSDSEHGVWIDDQNQYGSSPRKIAALGIAVKNKVTMHGFALNVTTDLSYFSTIIPCGITDKGQTSIQEELKKLSISYNSNTLMEETTELLIQEFCRRYGYFVEEGS
jgi:lipoyl(octanoyl) transferase